LASKFGYNYGLGERSISRGSINLILRAKKIKADLYIAHNLGALPAAVLAAKKHDGKCGFDAEDFHRQEVTDNPYTKDFKLKKFIEDKYLPRINYLTTSSPLISEVYKELYPTTIPQTILNVFPLENKILAKTGNKLKLFWFSQTVGRDRGIEQIISSLAYQDNVELHLLGYNTTSTQQYFNDLAKKSFFQPNNIFYYEPISSAEIITMASQFHIGLATETGVPLNRDICLTNKIFTYIQAGLAIIASDTSAQKWLLQEFEGMGFLYKRNNIDQLTNIIKGYLSHPELLREQQANALKYAQDELNWEHEKKKFLNNIVSVIGK